MTDIVPIPTPPTVPPYPALGSSNFNAEAYAYGSSMPAVVAAILAMNQAGYTNGVAAQERATAAGASAEAASWHASAASTARQGAQQSQDTAYTFAYSAGQSRDGAVAARDAASASASTANGARAAAEAARDQTLTMGAQVLTASSSTSLAIGTGAKTLTVETGRAFGPGMRLVLASAADPAASQMQGQVTSYDRSTGALSMLITSAAGSGSRSDWLIAVGGGDSGTLPVILVTANTSVQPNRCYVVAAAGITLTVSGTWVPGDRLSIRESIGAATYVLDFGATKVRSNSPGSTTVPAAFSQADFFYLDSTRGLI